MTDEEKATRELDALMLGAFTSGLEQGFTVGRGRPPRPEDLRTLNTIAKLVMTEVANSEVTALRAEDL
jgi:hypothetical protein